MHASQALIAEIQSVLEGGLEFSFEERSPILSLILEEKEYHVFTWEEFFVCAEMPF